MDNLGSVLELNSLCDKVYEYLRDQIMTGQLTPNTKLPENELASVRQVYKAIVANPKATYRGLAVQLDFAKDTIGRAIATLIRLKIIRREGNKQTGHWEVVK